MNRTVNTPSEHAHMIDQLKQTLIFLQLNAPGQVCENCVNLMPGRLCAKSGMAKVPDDYHGAGCGQWSEDLPF